MFGQRRGESPAAGTGAEPVAPGPVAVRGPGAIAESGPAALLRPEHAVVEFTGREAELAELRGWCGSDAARSVRVLQGAGGAGKTRLARQVAAGWGPEDGHLAVLPDSAGAEELRQARAAHEGRLLLIVDHAESRAGLDELLAATAEDPGPLRVLLLTRSIGEWWERLVERSPVEVVRLLTETEPVRLHLPVRPDAPDAALAQAAVPFFARALSVAIPGQVEVERAARRVPVLMLHAAALVAVLRHAEQPRLVLRVVVGDGVLDELLEYETRFWRGAAAAVGLPGDPVVVNQVVAAATVLGAGSVAEAAAVAARVPALAAGPDGRRQDWARWLYALFPAGPAGRLGMPRPEPLAETHLAAQLAGNHTFARSCLRELTPEQADRAMTMLARAARHQDRVRHVIARAVRGDLARLGLPTARAAVQTNSDVGELLARAISDAAAAPEALARVALGLPYPSAVLAPAHLAGALRALESLPPEADPETRAQWDDRAGLLLSQLDRHGDALRPAQEAVTIRRELAAADPARYRAGLAMSLANLGARFAEAGRPGEAVRAGHEASTIYRALADDEPDRYRADLARALTGLGVRYSEVGRSADALGAEREAVAIYRDLAAADPGRYRPDLAASLTNLGVWYSEADHPADAVPPTREAVAVYRELADATPGRYRPDLAAALTNLGIWFSELGRPADALAAEQEAVALRRELAASNPESYRSDLARSLGNLGIWFSELGRPADALRAEQEAVTIRREQAALSPQRYAPELASALTNLAITNAQLGQPADAVAPIKEAVTTYRDLALAEPDRYRPALARALTSLAIRYSELGRPAAAVAPIREAVTIRRKLAGARPDLYGPDLARSLSGLGARLAELGRAADAVLPEQEAVEAYRELAAGSPDEYRPDLARALSALAASLSALGRHGEASRADAEATAITQELDRVRAADSA
jgi:hypothetical protein